MKLAALTGARVIPGSDTENGVVAVGVGVNVGIALELVLEYEVVIRRDGLDRCPFPVEWPVADVGITVAVPLC